MAAELSARELRLARMRAQRLLPGHEAASVAEAARACLSIQAQDPPAAALALRARTRGATLEGLRAEAGGGSVLRAWLMRNTIHLFCSEDLAWMRPLLAERPRGPALKRLDQLGVPKRRRERILALLGERVASGPLPRDQARELVHAAGVPKDELNQRSYWLFQLAAIEGVIAVAPPLDQKQRFVAAPRDEPPAREGGYARLARRYLEAYGPATPRDLAYWGKLKLSDARAAFEALEDAEAVPTELGEMTALPGSAEPPAAEGPVVRLLPVWENYLLGYEDRAPAVPPPHDRFPGAGRPTATADGLAFAHWRVERARSSTPTLAIEPFDRVPRGARPGLEAEAADLGRFLETPVKLRVEE